MSNPPLRISNPLLAFYAAIFDMKNENANLNHTIFNDFVNQHVTNGHRIRTISDLWINCRRVWNWLKERDFFHGDIWKRSECDFRLYLLYLAGNTDGIALVRDEIESIIERHHTTTQFGDWRDFSEAMLQEIREYLLTFRPPQPFDDVSSRLNQIPLHDDAVSDVPDDDRPYDQHDKENRSPVDLTPATDINHPRLSLLLTQLKQLL
jgi:hypothetical protein